MIWNNANHQSEEQKEKNLHENSLRDFGDNIKQSNICIIGVPEEETKLVIENVFDEIMAENFSNLKKETDIQVQEAQRVLNQMNLNRPMPRQIIINMAKVKDKGRILKVSREKHRVIQKGTPHKNIS